MIFARSLIADHGSNAPESRKSPYGYSCEDSMKNMVNVLPMYIWGFLILEKSCDRDAQSLVFRSWDRKR
ncbi:unnamed protein product [Fusarium graminearum]|nr:unnamed protein product [Fusarium graminearum]